MAEYFFSSCPRGLENLLEQELISIGASFTQKAAGGVLFGGTWPLVYRANLESRLASRILWRVATGTYRNEHDVYALAYDIDWSQYFTEKRTLRIDLTATNSPLTSLAFATLRIKDAICDRFRAQGKPRPSIDKHCPDVRVFAYLTDNEIIFYLDTSGEALFKRNYRKHSEQAPLRENLAAGLLMLSGWQPGTALLDPFCGSGTIAIEAALMAANIAPGLNRAFAFQKLNHYDGAAWQRCKQKARDAVCPYDGNTTIFAGDFANDAVARAQNYAQAAHVADRIQFNAQDVNSWQAPSAQGIWLCNPPYGHRLEDQQSLARLYPLLGTTLKQRFAGWYAWFFTADKQLPKGLGLKPEQRIPLFNGALDCRLYGFKMIQGAMRRQAKSQQSDTQ